MLKSPHKRPASPPQGSPYRTKQEVAQRLRTSVRTVSRRWAAWGLTPIYIGGKWLAHADEIEGLEARLRESGERA